MSRFEPAAVVAIAVCLGSCALTIEEQDACNDSAECRQAFGALSFCADDGFCRRQQTLARCDRSYPEDLLSNPTRYPDPVLLGTIFDLSLATHVAREQSVELAATQANEVGGVLGKPVGVIFCNITVDPALDERTRTEAAVFTAEYLAGELEVWGIVGPAASTDVQAAFPAIQDTGTVMISPSATSPALAALDGIDHTDASPGLLWRTAPPDSVQGRVIAEDMTMRAVSDVTVVYETGAYGDELAAVFSDRFEGVIELVPFNSDVSRQTSVASALASDADEILFVSSQSSDIVAFLEAAEAGSATLGDKTIFLTDAAANADVLSGAQSARALFPRVRGTRPALPDGNVFNLFVASFDLAFQSDVSRFSFTANAYDAAWLLLVGVAWSQLQEDGARGDAVARGLRRVSSGPSFEIRAANLGNIVQQFRTGASVDVVGASGELDFDPSTGETAAPLDVWTIAADGASIDVERTVDP